MSASDRASPGCRWQVIRPYPKRMVLPRARRTRGRLSSSPSCARGWGGVASTERGLHMTTNLLVVGGERAPAAEGKTFSVIEPGTGGPMAEVAEAGPEDARRAVDVAVRAFEEGPWPKTSATERGRV